MPDMEGHNLTEASVACQVSPLNLIPNECTFHDLDSLAGKRQFAGKLDLELIIAYARQLSHT